MNGGKYMILRGRMKKVGFLSNFHFFPQIIKNHSLLNRFSEKKKLFHFLTLVMTLIAN